MIVYEATKGDFVKDIISNNIDMIIQGAFKAKLGYRANQGMVTSWKNSMMYMNNILNVIDIPDDAGVAIEYQINQTSKKIDFILTGQDSEKVDHAILIELKQWSQASLTDKDGIVSTFVGGRIREEAHRRC